MFSRVRGPVVTYELPKAYLASGDSIEAPIEDSIPAMRDSRYRRILSRAMDDPSEQTSVRFLDIVAARGNAKADSSQRIVRFEIERWEWNSVADPDNPAYGNLVASRTYSIPDAGD